jgi:hypothetical protein
MISDDSEIDRITNQLLEVVGRSKRLYPSGIPVALLAQSRRVVVDQKNRDRQKILFVSGAEAELKDAPTAELLRAAVEKGLKLSYHSVTWFHEQQLVHLLEKGNLPTHLVIVLCGCQDHLLSKVRNILVDSTVVGTVALKSAVTQQDQKRILWRDLQKILPLVRDL